MMFYQICLDEEEFTNVQEGFTNVQEGFEDAQKIKK